MLHIALQDGFTGESVIVRVNGREVLRKAAVKTRFQIGFAEEFETAVATPAAEVEVELPDKGLRQTITVPFEAREEMWLGISIDRSGGLTHRISKEAFGYV